MVKILHEHANPDEDGIERRICPFHQEHPGVSFAGCTCVYIDWGRRRYEDVPMHSGDTGAHRYAELKKKGRLPGNLPPWE